MSEKEAALKDEKLKEFIISFDETLPAKEITYQVVLADKLLVAHAVKRGVPGVLFEEINTNSPFDDRWWSSFLNINIRTLQRYRKAKDHIFKPIQSEKIFELAEVINLGNEVFDSPEQFNSWLNMPSPALGNEKPIDLLDTSYGKDLVLAELNNIEYGIFV
ncbi:conserved hypothetical protein [Chloroherpeton thalassium ATCC 35110]|uniref:Uncharacterized protein n=1 Tax=Chloroherpeton thalassium (strain ATCC 35110 / GB-78) TaxID=517418 RepID=B3QYQ5_CHLT3|nr:antitoxin Xre/MbcA/ParS toxin-binding domain-containing protein [Chloroherpeton thalassium]ACF15128.1 conserved hypothetical protein [Chloroherpeton thalassium ATCC 35110]